MSRRKHATYHFGKYPDYRIMLRLCANHFDCTYAYRFETGSCHISGTSENISATRRLFDTTIMVFLLRRAIIVASNPKVQHRKVELGFSIAFIKALRAHLVYSSKPVIHISDKPYSLAGFVYANELFGEGGELLFLL